MKDLLYVWCPTCKRVTEQRRERQKLKCGECGVSRDEKQKDGKVRDPFRQVRS